MHDHKSLPDQAVDALVVRARTEREAFGELYERNHQAIYRYCVRRLPDRTAAEDACADAFLAAARKISGFPGTTEEDFTRWLYRIATHEISARWRRVVRRRALMSAAAHRAEVRREMIANLGLEPVAEELDQLRQAVFQLESRDQSLIDLRYFAQMSTDQIALILDMRPGAVRTALTRALRKLRRLLPNLTD